MPNRARVSLQIATMRLMSPASSSPTGGVGNLASRSIDISLRSVAKPECISAEIERATARASRRCGQSRSSGWRSARYSRMARLSHTTRPLVLSAGTLPEGEWRRIAALLSGCRNLMHSSAKGMPQCFRASHGRKLQEEKFLSPITSV